ncbi:MAG: helix-turn-helix domain-containing protein [Candidatus Nanopelagicales bacterium]|nr:helix-turn-helix domain-containing protein [Candidatus Nanopelagicales bacterium]MCU0299799.1 helix-turn-helix domain-containing protein [Candidatus Nanopelagicales bacterium]
MQPLDFDACYRAVDSRDARFDGWFYTAVRTTGIYCRPSCPAITPKRRNVEFHRSAAAAQAAGFRACKRCRPDSSPGSPEWNTRSDVVARAMRLIRDGVVDREGVAGLANALGYTPRHVSRLVTEELGAGPLAIARTHRARTARTLLESTDLSAADIAFASGFHSVRAFNETIQQIYAVNPRQLRGHSTGTETITLRLATRQPFAGDVLLRFLGERAIPGVETWDGVTFTRNLRLPMAAGHASVTAQPDSVRVTLTLEDLRDLTSAVARLRRMLDLDADPVAIAHTLSPTLPIERIPGLRSPAAFDPEETAIRAVLGQQISVAAARTAAGRLAAGGPLFPTSGELAALDPQTLPMPRRRARTLVELATRLADGRVHLDPGADWDQAERDLLDIPGIGPWTAKYIRMRALGDPDVSLPGDLGIIRAAAHWGLDGDDARCKPWRSYATHYLWNLERD